MCKKSSSRFMMPFIMLKIFAREVHDPALPDASDCYWNKEIFYILISIYYWFGGPVTWCFSKDGRRTILNFPNVFWSIKSVKFNQILNSIIVDWCLSYLWYIEMSHSTLGVVFHWISRDSDEYKKVYLTQPQLYLSYSSYISSSSATTSLVLTLGYSFLVF